MTRRNGRARGSSRSISSAVAQRPAHRAGTTVTAPVVALADLVRSGVIEKHEAVAAANDPEALATYLSG